MKPIEVKLALGKETKGTYRFENEEADYPITTLYIRKSVSSGKPPQAIRLLVEAVGGCVKRRIVGGESRIRKVA